MAAEALILGAGALRVARRVGPTAWTVLTALALDAELGAPAPTARASVRSLAAQLGLNKDTVARALRRLRVAGLVCPASEPFALGSYTLAMPDAVIGFPLDALVARPRQPKASRVDGGAQLVLLEAE